MECIAIMHELPVLHVSCLLHCKIDHSLIIIAYLFYIRRCMEQRRVEHSQKSSSSWLDLCSNGDYSIPPTGLEFHNTQLLPPSVLLLSVLQFEYLRTGNGKTERDGEIC